MNISAFKKDDSMAEQGVWVEYMGARFKIVSTDSKRYRKAVLKITNSMNQTRLKKDAEAIKNFGVEVLAQGVLVDWEGVEEDDKPLEFNRENVMKVLAIEEVRNFLSTESQDLANFQQEALAEDADAIKSGD